MRSLSVFSAPVLILFVLAVITTGARADRGPITTLPAITGVEPMPASAIGPDYRGAPSRSLDDPIGAVFVVGTSWYDLAHNGSAGKMIGVDDSGYVHFVWTKGMDNANTSRYVYFNLWNPNTQAMESAGGERIDTIVSSRSGFISLGVLNGGWAFPAFHEILPSAGGLPHSAVGMSVAARDLN